jgi:hypothetical protein
VVFTLDGTCLLRHVLPVSILQQFDQAALELLKRARDYYGENLVTFAIYGSVARRAATFASDLDLLIVANALPQGRMPRIDQFTEHVENPPLAPLRYADRDYPLRVSAVIKTPDEVKLGSPLFLDMTEHCILLFDKGDFLAKCLEELREKLRAWGSEKRYSGGGYYWLLKPDLKPGEKIEL